MAEIALESFDKTGPEQMSKPGIPPQGIGIAPQYGRKPLSRSNPNRINELRFFAQLSAYTKKRESNAFFCVGVFLFIFLAPSLHKQHLK